MPRSSHPPQARQWFFLLCALSAALLLLRPAPAMEAVREALRLCSETIVPSLFPFLVFSALADLSIQILVQIPLYYNTFRDIICRYVIFTIL